MSRALVLGATGHIGAHVVRALLARGYTVRAAYRTPRYLSVLDGLPVERVQLDLDRPDGLPQALRECETVFHCAGYYPRLLSPRAPAIARGIAQIQRVCEMLAAANLRRVVYTSSAATIAPRLGRLSTEENAEPWPLPRRRPRYATVKVAMEHEVRRYAQRGLPVVIVNPSLCLGEYDAHAFSGRLLLWFAKRRLPICPEMYFNVVYTGDAGFGHVAAAERGRTGERYLLATENLSLLDLARLVAGEAGVEPPRWQVPVPWLTRYAQRLDGSKARRELGMPATPAHEAVRRSLAWFRQQGYN